MPPPGFFFFFFNDTATTEIYTLSLHDALPISMRPIRLPATAELGGRSPGFRKMYVMPKFEETKELSPDRKSTRLNSSHSQISYAVFCLKKKKLSVSMLENSLTKIEGDEKPGAD